MKFLVKVVIATCFMLFIHELTIQSVTSQVPDISSSEPKNETAEPYITVILQRTYLDGEVSEEILSQRVHTLEKFLEQRTDWQLVDRDDMQIVLQKRIDDISPLLKTSGYFGVSKEGILQIFKGVPKTNNVIQSFFQIDTRKMKSYQRRQLEKGIRIKSKERYEKVLIQMKPYSIKRD
ncbi:BofC C-terminal domain-containing protein [Bacillus sp. 165]|uniref:BofC C-terminal domain-containing protein n=1 Tax=Bacillus sp. 165 TaxID=1529117 RepID=UPI001ADD320A|nr:BofC C-terminal domain-containing protein [Bacillus sp. 165]